MEKEYTPLYGDLWLQEKPKDDHILGNVRLWFFELDGRWLYKKSFLSPEDWKNEENRVLVYRDQEGNSYWRVRDIRKLFV